MNIETAALMLMIVSALTGLTTEGIKKILDELGRGYYANILAGCVAVVLSTLVGIGYVVATGAAVNGQLAVYLIALVFLSWLCAMVGYDKVIQTLSQLKED